MDTSRLTYEQFCKYVLTALEQLDSGYLAASPLVELLLPVDEPAVDQALRRLLRTAIENLRPARDRPGSAIATRRYQHLVLRYVNGASLDEICSILGVSDRQARRDHHEAVEALCRLLWGQRRSPSPAAGELPSPPWLAGRLPSWAEHDIVEDELQHLTPALSQPDASIAEVALSALATIRSLAEVKAVECRVAVPEASPTLQVNRSALRQALVLLLALAVETEKVRSVTVQLTEDPQRTAMIIVTTTAPGRSSTSSPAADDRFQIARRLIETLGGTLDVRLPDAEGFQFLIQWPSPSITTVLALDDNPDMLRLLQRYLAGTSYRLLPATTAERALSLLRTAHPNIILLDLMMPAQDGWELLEEMRENAAGRTVPVIVCSVLRERALAMSLGAADFLSKPLTRSALLSALARCQPVVAALPTSP